MHRRRLTRTGVKPVGDVHYRVETCSVDGAVEPTTGDRFSLEVPQMNTVNFQIFLHALAQPYQETLNTIVMDKNSCHKAASWVIPEHSVPLCLPPYRPELHPMERVWQDWKAQLAWGLAAHLEELDHQVASRIRQDAPAALHTLTS